MNVRAIYGCRQVGAGHEHLKNFVITSLCFQITTKKTTDFNQWMCECIFPLV